MKMAKNNIELCHIFKSLLLLKNKYIVSISLPKNMAIINKFSA